MRDSNWTWLVSPPTPPPVQLLVAGQDMAALENLSPDPEAAFLGLMADLLGFQVMPRFRAHETPDPLYHTGLARQLISHPNVHGLSHHSPWLTS